MTHYVIIDAPGHHGDHAKVYRVSRSLAAARRWIGGSPQFAIVRCRYRAWTRGDTIHRTTTARLDYVQPEDAR